MKKFWTSWYAADVPFTWHDPWWISGYRPLDDGREQDMICAAVKATDEEHAKSLIVQAHDKPVSLEWRFVEERLANWTPFSERFPRAAWMQWA